jgi:hypothetical protein
MSDTTEQHPVQRVVFVATLVAGLCFAAHAGWRIAQGHETARVEDWMSARHVAHVFGLPTDVLVPLVGGPSGGPLPYGPLRDLAAAQGKPSAALVAEVQAQVDALSDGP